MKQLALLNTEPTHTEPVGRDDFATLSHPVAILADGATAVPSELRLFAAGEIDTTKGLFRFDAESAASVMKCSRSMGHDLPFDYEHASVFAMFATDPAEAGKAAGWFRPEIRNGECWATGIQWTPKATEKILAKEFRYTSPTFRHDKSETPRVLEIYGCALTNGPATKQSKPITASRKDTLVMASNWVPMCFGASCSSASTCCQACPVKETCCSICRCPCPPDPSGPVDAGAMQMSARESFSTFLTKEHSMKTVLAALSLKDTASEAETLVAVNQIREQLNGIVALTGKTVLADAIGIIQGWRAGADQVAALSAQLAEIRTKQAADEIEGLITAAKADGRLPPASEKAAREVAKSGVAALKSMLSVLPKLAGDRRDQGDGATGAEGGEVVTLTADEKEQARKARIPEEKMLATKKTMLAQRAGK